MVQPLHDHLRNKLGKARLFVPYEAVPLGYEGVVTYVRPLRGGAGLRSIDVRLQCEEQLIQEKTNADGDGYVKSINKTVVIDEPVAAALIPMADELRVEIPVRIPESGPSSLFEERNSLHWYVQRKNVIEEKTVADIGERSAVPLPSTFTSRPADL